MITAITMQWAYNTKYLAAANEPKIYGQKTITDLQKELQDGIIELTKINNLVTDLNGVIKPNDVAACIEFHLGIAPRITNKTKTKRTYAAYGLTIHEEDQQKAI